MDSEIVPSALRDRLGVEATDGLLALLDTVRAGCAGDGRGASGAAPRA